MSGLREAAEGGFCVSLTVSKFSLWICSEGPSDSAPESLCCSEESSSLKDTFCGKSSLFWLPVPDGGPTLLVLYPGCA